MVSVTFLKVCCQSDESFSYRCCSYYIHGWLVAPFCKVEGHIEKVDDLFVSFDCDFKTIRFEHLADFLLVFFNFFCSGLANCEAIVTVQTNFIFEFWCYQG